MRLAIIVGARPHLIKLAPLEGALRAKGVNFFTVHTGQHYDPRMSSEFIRELGITSIIKNLNIGSGPNEWQISQGVLELKAYFTHNMPTHILVIGDANAVAVGAITGEELCIPVIHCEAGLRSYELHTQEEKNRVLVDQIAEAHFCSTTLDLIQLERERSDIAPIISGDLLVDAITMFNDVQKRPIAIASTCQEKFWLFTMHREENANNFDRVRSTIDSVVHACPHHVLWVVHPRLKMLAEEYANSAPSEKLLISEPLTYSEMNYARDKAELIITDANGLQVESYLLKKPCIIIRDKFEHLLLQECRASVRVHPAEVSEETIKLAADQAMATCWDLLPVDLYGTPGVAERIVDGICERFAVWEGMGRTEPCAAYAVSG